MNGFNSLLLVFLASLQLGFAQPWNGANTTDVTYRDGNVVIGGTSILGTYGGSAKILQLQGSPTWFSMVPSVGSTASFNLALLDGGVGFYARERLMLFSTSPVGGPLVVRMTIKADGDLGIGTQPEFSNPNNYKLAVNGKIGAKEVQVENT